MKLNEGVPPSGEGATGVSWQATSASAAAMMVERAPGTLPPESALVGNMTFPAPKTPWGTSRKRRLSLLPPSEQYLEA